MDECKNRQRPKNFEQNPDKSVIKGRGDIMPHALFNNLIWLGTEEAAKYLRKTTNAIRIAVHRGHLKCYKWRRRLYFKRDELDRLLESSLNNGGI